MHSALVVAQALSYRYPLAAAPLLHDLDFTIHAGEFVVLAGASGCGKSTLCRLLTGLIPHLHGGTLHGQLRIAGHDPQHMPPHQLNRVVGLLLQRPDAQCLASNVTRDVAFGAACQGLPRPHIFQRVDAALQRLHIQHLAPRSPHTLSGGEQQRVALAGVLALQPALLILDEPFAFLDAPGAAQLRHQLRQLHESGITLIVAEHRLAQLTDLATRIMVLQHGRLVANAAPHALGTPALSAWGLELAAAAPPMVAHATPPPSALIEWENIHYQRAGHMVLDGASLQVGAGEIVALCGNNGAGKSTLLRHGNGLLRPERGTVRVLGAALGQRSVAEVAATVGLVMQQPAHMLFASTVRLELEAGPRAMRRYDAAWLAQLSERFGLTDLLERPPYTLSAGEQRRVALAAVLATRPRVLLLDEPTAGQDAAACATLRHLLAACAEDGIAIVIATHDMHWAARVATRQVVLQHGRMQAFPAATPPSTSSSAPQTQTQTQTSSFDPRAELVIYLLYCLLIFLATTPVALLVLLTALLLALHPVRAWGAWWRALKLLWPTLLLFLGIVALSAGWEAGSAAALRLLALVTAGVLLFTRTTVEAMAEALLTSGLSSAAAFLLEGTLRFTPTMASLVREVRAAQESRGRRLGGLWLVRNSAAFLGAVLAGVMRFADDLAEALEVRGFGSTTRTPLAAYRWRSQDWLLLAGGVVGAVTIAVALWR